jgi:molybdenum-dependent DNA-binding transcriptional regulator ModE
MKTLEHSTTTTLTDSESSPVTNKKMVALLKLVYYERKSIKQASNYLHIKYNTAKRIIKKFRRNQISLDKSELEDHHEERSKCAASSERVVISKLLSEISCLSSTLKQLNNDIACNKRIIAVLGSLMKHKV